MGENKAYLIHAADIATRAGRDGLDIYPRDHTDAGCLYRRAGSVFAHTANATGRDHGASPAGRQQPCVK